MLPCAKRFSALGRLRPGALGAADLLEGVRHLQHAQVVKACAGNLQPDGQAAGGVAAVDRSGRLLRHVERHREPDVLQRAQRVVGGGGQLGGERGHGGHGREHVIKPAARLDGGHARGVELLAGLEDLGAGHARSTLGPGADVGQHLGALRFGQGLQVGVRAHAPEAGPCRRAWPGS